MKSKKLVALIVSGVLAAGFVTASFADDMDDSSSMPTQVADNGMSGSSSMSGTGNASPAVSGNAAVSGTASPSDTGNADTTTGDDDY